MADIADLFRRKGAAGIRRFDSGSAMIPGTGTSYADYGLANSFPGLFGIDDNPESRTFGQSVTRGVPEGYRFGGADPNNRMTGNPTTSQVGRNQKPQSLRLLTGMTVREATKFLYSLDNEALTKIQNELHWAGMLDEIPQWGILDETTRKGFQTFVVELARKPDMSAGELLEQATKGYRTRLHAAMDDESKAKKKAGGGSGGVDLPEDILLQPAVTSALTLEEMIDGVSQELFGRDLAPDRKQALIAQLQQKEKDQWYATEYRQRKEQLDREMAGLRTENGETELDAFMNAIMMQESGGDPNAVNVDSGAMGLFQIMPENWPQWAREAGVDIADRSPENQKRVARFKMAEYYKSFGNWRDVAISWYAGPGAVGASWLDRPQDGYPSVNSYVDSIMSKMKTAATAEPIMRDPTLSVEWREKLDLTNEARSILRAANPAEYEGTKFAKQAQNFFSLLAGLGR